MNWDSVVAALLAEVADVPEIAAIVGGRVYFAGSGAFVVPSVELTIVADTVSELWEPVTVQFDVWAKSFTDVRTIERILRRRYHHQLPIPIGGLNVWAQYSDGTVLASPERDKFFGRALRFTFTPLRAAYTGG
jgi:hypothetical protein